MIKIVIAVNYTAAEDEQMDCAATTCWSGHVAGGDSTYSLQMLDTLIMTISESAACKLNCLCVVIPDCHG